MHHERALHATAHPSLTKPRHRDWSPAVWLCTMVLGLLPSVGIAANKAEKAANPDFTAGDAIPKGFTKDWNLGATGARGWMFSDRMVTTDARQIKITKIAAGSPAASVLAVDDVILGVGGKPFAYDPRTEFGKALTAAESDAGRGKLTVTRWRAGKTEDVVITLPVLGTYSATAPFTCPKSSRILEQGFAKLAQSLAKPGYGGNPIVRSLNGLALLASGKAEYLPLIKKEAEWAAGFTDKSTWYYGYLLMFLAEYQAASGDQSVTAGMQRLAVEAAKGQSAVGSWGHAFANPDGRLKGYGMMNAPGVPLTIGLVMARAAGVKDPEVSLAIERSTRLLRFYTGKGSIPYGDHAPWIETHDDNGKNGSAAVLFNLLDESGPATFFTHMSISSHGPERDCGHTGNFFNITWAMPGVALSGPNATGAWMREFGSWYYDLARTWEGGFVHLGPPEPDNDSYANWDNTGAILLAYAMPLKKLWLTGKRPGKVAQLTPAQTEVFIRSGPGWDNKDRNSFYDQLSIDELMTRLASWSPVVRERAAMAFGRRKKDAPIDRIVALLDSPSLEARLGACQAIEHLGAQSATAVPALQKALHADDLWLRIKAGEALAGIGKPARVAIPDMLALMASVDTTKDPRGMQQRYLSESLFSRRGLLGQSLDGVDRKQLTQAILAGLKNEDGRARGEVASVFRLLTPDDLRPLLPAIMAAVEVPSPSGEMFADGVRLEGLRTMAKLRIEEGMAACVAYISNQNPWASEHRTPEILAILSSYGACATPLIPELEKIAAGFSQGEKDFPKHLSLQKAAAVRKTIAELKTSTERPVLVPMPKN